VSRSPYPLDIVCSNQAAATKNHSVPISCEYPATIRIEKSEQRHTLLLTPLRSSVEQTDNFFFIATRSLP
jgi:hypothetical protein